MLNMDDQIRRSSEITCQAADMYHKDLEVLEEKQENQQQLYLSLSKSKNQLCLDYKQKLQQQQPQNSRLFDLRKKYLKNRDDQYRRSVSHHESHIMNRSPQQRQPQKCFSPKQENRMIAKKSLKQPQSIKSQPLQKNNLRNILKSNFQQATFEENPEFEYQRKEVTQLIDIPQHLQSLELYQFGKTLGFGATAEVKLARHSELDISVAIKIYDKKKMNPQNLKNLSREVDILLQLRHPNIIRLYHMVDSDKSIYLILEYSSPACLDSFMKGRPFKRINEDEARILFKQLADAISYLHSERVAHRDLKLENILIDYQTKKIKVIDFGYSVKIDYQQKQLIACGTPSYMAPEIVKKAPYDLAVDVWSCGIVLFKLLTGVFPFRGNSEKDLNKKILQAKIEYPSFISQNAKSLINQMLRVEPKDRIQIHDVLNHSWLQ